MNSFSTMPWTSSVISAYTAFAASAMLVRSIFSEFQSMASQLIPHSIRERILSKFLFLFAKPSLEMTLTIDERFDNCHSANAVYEAALVYLQGKISPHNNVLRVTKHDHDKDMSVAVGKGEEVLDSYQGIGFKWVMMVCTESDKEEHRSFELRFSKKHKDLVLASYLPHILEFAKLKKEENRVVRLETLGGDHWGSSVDLNHPSTFDTLAMDPTLKKAIMDDLDRFVKRREFYKRVGKAWKRGYLLYGPPGTGKSSLIAAMANYLKFNVYDVELTGIRDNLGLRDLLVSTQNRSILVIEDIDCSIELQNRNNEGYNGGGTGLTLSGLLNFIDGLWSSCSDERIIVFTTNYKDKLDPALLRPGRMDMHIHMSYLTPSGFRVLAFNYLGVRSHDLFSEIESLIQELEITPATVAEQLMRGNEDDDADADATLGLLLEFLENKRSEALSKSADVQGAAEEESQETTMPTKVKVKGSKSKKVRRRSRKRDYGGGRDSYIDS